MYRKLLHCNLRSVPHSLADQGEAMTYSVLESAARGDRAGTDWIKRAVFHDLREAVEFIGEAEAMNPSAAYIILDAQGNRMNIHALDQWEFHAHRSGDIEEGRMVCKMFIEDADTVRALASLYLRLHKQYDSLRMIHRSASGEVLRSEEVKLNP